MTSPLWVYENRNNLSGAWAVVKAPRSPSLPSETTHQATPTYSHLTAASWFHEESQERRVSKRRTG